MLGELGQVEGRWAVAMWAMGGASVLARSALISFFIPGRGGQNLVPGGGLLAKSFPLRKVTLVACGVFVLGALLFFLAPPFRQGVRISLAAWQDLLIVSGPEKQGSLVAIAKRAEEERDAEGLAFAAARLRNPAESARLAERAVQLDPNLIWIYGVVAVRHPALPEIPRWVSELKRWDPQNALFDLITAESIDLEHVNRAGKLSVLESQKQKEDDPAWQNAMAAAFASPKLDDYLDRLGELDRRVISRYRFDDPHELLWGERAGLPTYAYSDSQRYAQSLLQSGHELEMRGDRKGALEKYWAVARFGQVMDVQARSRIGPWSGTALQAMAYERLKALSEKEGNASEAAHFGYLAAKFDPNAAATLKLYEDRFFGWQVTARNAAVLQVASLLLLIFSGVMVVSAMGLAVASRKGDRPETQRSKSVATGVLLAGALGFLLSTATIYLTYRPYWYIFQHEILKGDRSHAGDLRDFLWATQGGPAARFYGLVTAKFPLYFWMGVILLGVIGLVLILLRHFLGRPPANASA
jgi:hypothetical protein